MATLNLKQQKALEAMKAGKNIFLTGGAGVGKSFLVKEFISWAKKEGKNVAVCAPTGIAALNVGGVTCHSAFRLPLGPVPIEEVKNVKIGVDTIIIDEVSMLRFDTFGRIVKILLAQEKRPQLILVGDFYQLPPVIMPRDRSTLEEYYPGAKIGKGFAFQSGAWKAYGIETIELTESVRQKDDDGFAAALNAVRVSDFKGIEYIVNHSSKHKFVDGVALCPTNKEADNINLNKLSAIRNKSRMYYAFWKGEVNPGDYPAATRIELKVGARVIICGNDSEGKYCNGSQGTVTQLFEDSVTVELDNGNKVNVKRFTWKAFTNAGGEQVEIGSYNQIPVKLGWAITVHKSQGMTLEKVNLNPKMFEVGQLYVALSRLTKAEGLFINGSITPNDLRVSEEVKNFYGKL